MWSVLWVPPSQHMPDITMYVIIQTRPSLNCVPLYIINPLNHRHALRSEWPFISIIINRLNRLIAKPLGFAFILVYAYIRKSASTPLSNPNHEAVASWSWCWVVRSCVSGSSTGPAIHEAVAPPVHREQVKVVHAGGVWEAGYHKPAVALVVACFRLSDAKRARAVG